MRGVLPLAGGARTKGDSPCGGYPIGRQSFEFFGSLNGRRASLALPMRSARNPRARAIPSPTYQLPSNRYPFGITTGPDGALWFTNWTYNGTNYMQGSIGRISTTGVVSALHPPSIVEPTGITTVPDGALWFTNYGTNSIGRITTAGAISKTPIDMEPPSMVRQASPPVLTMRPLVYQRQRHHWADHHRRSADQSCLSRARRRQRSRLPKPIRHHGGTRWSTVVHKLRHVSGCVGCTVTYRISLGGSRRRGLSPSTPTPACSKPEGIASGPDGALWFTNFGNVGYDLTPLIPGSIGRITTTGIVSNYTDPSIEQPTAITTGPDGALWFLNGEKQGSGALRQPAGFPPLPSTLILEATHSA